MISVVIPAYQEGDGIVEMLCKLLSDQQPKEVTVIDASGEAEVQRVVDIIAQRCPAPTLTYQKAAAQGRACQLNQGAAQSAGDILLFLHADTKLPSQALDQIEVGLGADACWGRFDVHFDNSRWPFRMIGFMMNWRSRLSGIATGDQAMFMTRGAFEQVGGFDEIPLMEDIAISVKLKKLGHPLCLKSQVTTAARRWETRGIVRTILLMWGLRLSYCLGLPAERLAGWYRS